MTCSSHIVKTTYPNGRVDYELHCYGACDSGECAETYVSDPEPQNRVTTVLTCACCDEVETLT
jgi:hypothetical protein